MNRAKPDLYHQRTRAAFMWSRILRTPFWAIYSMLPFILYRDLNASPMQIAFVIALKPAVSLLSMYWSSMIHQRPDRLVSNVIWASVLGMIPFFFFPFVDNPWYFIFSFGFFMLLHRGVIPAWMEIMKINLGDVSQKRVFAWGSAFGYLGDAVLPFLFGGLLDGYFQSWRLIFPAAATISLLAIIFQSRMMIKGVSNLKPSLPRKDLKTQLTKPWKEAWNLIRERADFRNFQVGFMLGGGGLMLMHTVLPQFYMGVLELSYTELAIALTLCKGVGFALTSPLWARFMDRVDIYRFSGSVTAFAIAFPLLLLVSQFYIGWLYLAYIMYGVMQAGSELSWNLSGPIFSRREDSSVYSSVNILTVGLRGCVAPALGVFLCSISSPSTVLLIGGGLCFLATASMFSCSRQSTSLVLEQ